jgi:hypothetical protein
VTAGAPVARSLISVISRSGVDLEGDALQLALAPRSAIHSVKISRASQRGLSLGSPRSDTRGPVHKADKVVDLQRPPLGDSFVHLAF